MNTYKTRPKLGPMLAIEERLSFVLALTILVPQICGRISDKNIRGSRRKESQDLPNLQAKSKIKRRQPTAEGKLTNRAWSQQRIRHRFITQLTTTHSLSEISSYTNSLIGLWISKGI
jgi:hypothetical protein